jgi:hypothetical protein
VVEETDDGKSRPRKIGMRPIQRDGTEYEFDVVGDMDQDNTLVISKTRCPDLAGQVLRRPDIALAATLWAWLTDGEATITETQAREFSEALNAAGLDARRAWLDRFGCKPTALPESRLDEAKLFVAGLRPAENTTGTGSDGSEGDGHDLGRTEPEPVPVPASSMSESQSRRLHALLRAKRNASRGERFPVLTELLGREITSTKEVTSTEADDLIERLDSEPQWGDDDGPETSDEEPEPLPWQGEEPS